MVVNFPPNFDWVFEDEVEQQEAREAPEKCFRFVFETLDAFKWQLT